MYKKCNRHRDCGMDYGHDGACSFVISCTLFDDLKTNASKLDSARRNAIIECSNAITKHIVKGPLPGNGCDETAQRNGLILASNLLFQMLEPPK